MGETKIKIRIRKEIKKFFRQIIALILIIVFAGANITLGFVENEVSVDAKQKTEKKIEVVRELVDERTENSNTYLLSDGSKKLEMFVENIRYKNNGRLTEYNTELGKIVKEDKNALENKAGKNVDKYTYVNISGDSKQYFPKNLTENTGVIMNHDKYVFSFAPDMTNDAYVSNVKDNMITYSLSDSNIDYQYFSQKNGVKENIILYSKPQNNVFQFQLDSKNIKFQLIKGYGGIYLLDEKNSEIVGCIEPPNIVDGEGNISYEDVKYNIEKKNGQEILKLTVNKSFLENKDLKYPVTIDPTAIWFSDKLSLAAVCNMQYTAYLKIPAQDVYVNKKCRTEPLYGGTEQRVFLDTTNVMSGHAFVGGSVDIRGKYIQSAELHLTEQDSAHKTGTVEIRKPKTIWSTDSITWNNQPALEDEIVASFSCSGISNTVHNVDLTEWAQRLANGETEDTGLAFLAKEDGTGEKINGPGIKYTFNSDGTIKQALYMSISITYRDMNIKDIDLVEYDYATKIERRFNYEYDGTLNNVIEQGYVPIGLHTAESLIQPFAIYPGDILERANQNVFPYSTIVHFRWENDINNDGIVDQNIEWGSGYIVGPNTVVTAGHCVTNGGEKWIEKLTVFPQFNGSYSTGGYNVKKVICPIQYVDNKTPDYDWAILTIDGNIGEQTGWLGFRITDNLLEKNITVSGYKKLDGDLYPVLYKHSGKITDVIDGKIFYNASTISGQSGSPVFDENNIALGIHTTSYGTANGKHYDNGGVRINPCIYSLLKEKRELGKTEYNYK